MRTSLWIAPWFVPTGCGAHLSVGCVTAVSGARLRKGGDCESAELIKEDPARVEVRRSAPLNCSQLHRQRLGF